MVEKCRRDALDNFADVARLFEANRFQNLVGGLDLLNRIILLLIFCRAALIPIVSRRVV